MLRRTSDRTFSTFGCPIATGDRFATKRTTNFPTHDHYCKFALVDKLTKEQRKKNMQAVKATGSKIETALAKSLFARGHRYRKNDKTAFGKSDLTFKKLKIAIFVDTEFWHGKDWETKKKEHKSNKAFWFAQIERNIERDEEVNSQLLKDGWIILRFLGSGYSEKFTNLYHENRTENK